ncbi:hypothetical protein F0L17_14495 [Streptomyces sp. TRM43335]|uniref:Uncharacterized protein n=1 Tax=Streptomyces taklimakanensis TaxID=2569853 RepID=A0A6G2BDT9_9ACTN|nr:hypothetical protein [Streptomyces taklimakanensis]MTE20296.1 hypothetical protein [Streptomyces taklimakanensis]
MARTVETTTIHSLDTTVLLVRMNHAQLRQWDWIATSDHEEGTLAHLIETDAQTPIEGYEVRDANGALLGAILIRRRGTIHAEMYDPTADDFFSLGDTPNCVTSQGIAFILHAHRQAGHAIPTGDNLVTPTYSNRPGICHWLHCSDAECVDHGQTTAPAKEPALAA